jgi:hypothetical protein
VTGSELAAKVRIQAQLLRHLSTTTTPTTQEFKSSAFSLLTELPERKGTIHLHLL